MKSGGIGGGNTITGLHFEKKTYLSDLIKSLQGYSVDGDNVFFKKTEIGRLLKGYKIYKYLDKRGIKWNKYISCRLIPDDALLIDSLKTIFIIEKKFQKTEGSVDEKLQTCDFKKKQYTKLFDPLEIKVEYIYVLSDWFNDPAYADSKKYIADVGCKWFIETIPLSELGLTRVQE
jgi:hypothetical protein